MSEELKTIKELADELGVNKQNVQYHIKSLPNKERLKNEKGQEQLNNQVSKKWYQFWK
ncbi:hypothetical protein GTP06_12520 [Lactococcus lactis]|uniref:helix-turn-helix domain-containing protein n=1 Tax=Lactococcus lactis TaxID=1358 RepID=UPI0013C8AD1E|nr:helix-turn-helix domain-containing protein [Lactococcus lactis]NEX59115.1 hypothetical protein [Lactococcus lactis]